MAGRASRLDISFQNRRYAWPFGRVSVKRIAVQYGHSVPMGRAGPLHLFGRSWAVDVVRCRELYGLHWSQPEIGPASAARWAAAWAR